MEIPVNTERGTSLTATNGAPLSERVSCDSIEPLGCKLFLSSGDRRQEITSPSAPERAHRQPERPVCIHVFNTGIIN